jgi:hypothetical protein
MAADLSTLDLVAVMVDGVGFDAPTLRYAIDAKDYQTLADGQQVRVWLPQYHMATSRIEPLQPDGPAT